MAKYLLYFTVVLLLPLGVSILYDFFIDKPHFHIPTTVAFLVAIAITLGLAGLASLCGNKAQKRELYRKEGILFVVIIWLLTTALSALPFQLTRAIPNPVDAYFETMSGLTTTGASIIQAKAYDAEGKEIPIVKKNPLDAAITYTFYGTVAPIRDPHSGAVLFEGVEALGKPLLFWRSFLQWLGGIGIVVLFISVLPALGVGGKFLYESEMPGLTKEGMTPHIRKTADALWKIYVGLTVAQIVLHMVTDPSMSLFDAVTLSFSTISTGGFLVHNAGLNAYNSMIGWVMAVFMILAGISFALYYQCLKRRFHYLKDPEFIAYLIILIGSCILLSWTLWDGGDYSFKDIAGRGPFQTISAVTTTGFSIINYDVWPMSVQMLLLFLMYFGGMSGSAVGGLKIIRCIVVFRVIVQKVESFFRPGVVRVIRIGHKDVSNKIQMSVFAFFCVMLFLVVIGSYLLILDRVDPLTALGVVSTTITNTGLLFGGIGSQESLGFLSNFSKIVGTLWMLFGRLEFFSLLVLLIPSFWRNR
ncbi:MAG TPA: TrkH family potassium uptake protein [Rhabdochlamydiaceae bacterium]|jgi:trk system potassium uptake protein TrkH